MPNRKIKFRSITLFNFRNITKTSDYDDYNPIVIFRRYFFINILTNLYFSLFLCGVGGIIMIV